MHKHSGGPVYLNDFYQTFKKLIPVPWVQVCFIKQQELRTSYIYAVGHPG